jgi:uracil phosphoribosyltransferase
MSNVTIVEHPLVQHKLSIMRDKTTSTASFRMLMKEVSLLLGYEVTRELPTQAVTVETPMGKTQCQMLAGKKAALVSILRAGNGLLEGMLELMPYAPVGFVGLYRDEETLKPVEYYFKVPAQLDQRVVIVVDPMLATGHSSIAAIQKLKDAGAKQIRFVCLLAAPEGIEAFTQAHPDVPVVTAAVDDRLNDIGYIEPGLGDAGDRLYGTR